MRLPAGLIAVALGGVYAASFAPLSHWAVALCALGGLVTLLDHEASRGTGPAGLAGTVFVFAFTAFASGLAWLYVSLHDIGGLPAPLAVAAVAAFSAYLALYASGAGLLWARWGQSQGLFVRSAAFGVLWTIGELARGVVFSGFPWLALGYSQIDGPFDPLAPLLGVHGLGLAAASAATLLASALMPRARRWPAVIGLLLLLALPVLLPQPQWVRPSGSALTVRLVQGNVEQDLKFQPERSLAAMQAYTAAFEQSRAALTVLPETAWTQTWEWTPETLVARIEAHASQGHALALGLPAIHPPGPDSAPNDFRYSNSVLLIEPGGRIQPADPTQRYDKHHLVPFGEFVPWGFRWFVDLMRIPLGDFSRGTTTQAPLAVGGQRIAFNICYEDLFGDEIRRPLQGEAGATVLINVSNLGWFGDSHALPQHLAIARLRSLETGRPMLRATNTGITAAIDAQGRVMAQLPAFQAGVLDVSVQGTEGITPYVRWGDGLLWGVLGIALIGLLVGKYRESANRSR